QAGVSLVMNGSFEKDGFISDITVQSPRKWCDVNLPAGQFGGWVSIDWKSQGNYSLSLWSNWGVEFTAGDMATVSQQVYLKDVNHIIFDLRLSDVGGVWWDPAKRSALILIDGNVIWDSGDLVPNVSGEYLNQMVDVNEIYKDESPHTLSLAIRSNVSEIEWFYQFQVQWDFVKFDAHCGGFGYLPEDINYDCYVDELDLKLMTEQWLSEDLNLEYDLFRDDEDIINFPDFAVFSSYWRDNNCPQSNGCGGSDFNRSGMVDSADLKIFAEHWLGEVVLLLSDLTEDDTVNFRDYAGLANRLHDNTDWVNWQDENCFELELSAADVDYNGIVNLRDLAIVIDDLESEEPCMRSDIDGSGIVDYGDLSRVIDEWLLKSWVYGLE
ncbi:MAG: hypothetical protein ACYS67_11675, partial [Planctomycetota bacterium]